MNKYRFSSKLPTDESNKGSQDPHSIKKPVTENTPKQKSEQTVTKTERAVEHVVPPVLVTEYKLTVQTKVEPASQAHAQPRFTLGQQKHKTAAPVSDPMDKPILAANKKGWPSSPTRNHKLDPQTKVEQVKDHEVNNNTGDKPKSPVPDPNHSSQAKPEPGKDSKAINNKWDKPLTTVPEQKYSSPIKSGPLTNFGGFNDDKRDMPSSPIYGQTHSSPRKSYGVIDEKRDKPILARDHDKAINYGPVDNKWGKTSTHIQERPEKVDKFLTNVQAEASRPTRPWLLGGKNWRDLDTNGYDEYTNYSNKGLDKPSNDTVRYKQAIEPYDVGRSSEVGGKNWRDIDGDDVYGEYANHSNNDLDRPSNDIVRYEQVIEPYTAGKRGWEGPRKKEWAIPPTQVTPLFGPTNDIGKAVEILKGAVISAPPPRYNYNYTDSRDPIRDKYIGAIDSREAQRRFGNPNLSTRPSYNYTRTISSTEAARKYGGAPV